jgi:sulfur carrier protein
MQITMNGEIDAVKGDQITVAQLLLTKKVESPEMVSVQLNGEIIERSQYETQNISDGDEVDFLYFMGGGADK